MLGASHGQSSLMSVVRLSFKCYRAAVWCLQKISPAAALLGCFCSGLKMTVREDNIGDAKVSACHHGSGLSLAEAELLSKCQKKFSSI